MPWLLEVHGASTWALVGLIWTIQWVHYPLFESVGEAEFIAYHRRHTTRVTFVVGPLMLAELATAGALFYLGERDRWWWVSVLPLGFNWVCTWRVQVPLHERLGRGFNREVHRRLVVTNWWRTVAWTIRGFCLLMMSR